MKKQIVLKIYRKVQGVFFRDGSRRKARELNLSGFASNEPDGTVRVIAEGEEEELKEFIKWCKNGSDHAKVEKMDIKWTEPTDEFDDFVIK